MQRILEEDLLAPFGDTRACCLLALARRCTVFFALRLSNIEMGGRDEDRNRQQPRDRRDGTNAGSPRHHFLLQTFSSWGRENVVLATALRGLCVALEAPAAESVIKIAVRRT